jgi:hypothetical protein
MNSDSAQLTGSAAGARTWPFFKKEPGHSFCQQGHFRTHVGSHFQFHFANMGTNRKSNRKSNRNTLNDPNSKTLREGQGEYVTYEDESEMEWNRITI